jgi:enoyl-CoA hydratase
MMTKERISRSYESMLGEGIRFERRVFHAMFATADRKECAAFIAKRTPEFEHK